MPNLSYLRFDSEHAAESALARIEAGRDLLPEGTWVGRGYHVLFFRTEATAKELGRALTRIATGREPEEG